MCGITDSGLIKEFMTKGHNFKLSYYVLGYTSRNNNERNAIFCIDGLDSHRSRVQSTTTGSFAEQQLIIEPIPLK